MIVSFLIICKSLINLLILGAKTDNVVYVPLSNYVIIEICQWVSPQGAGISTDTKTAMRVFNP